MRQLEQTTNCSIDKRIGLLAGSGRFPIAVAQAARSQGYLVYCLGVLGMASEELETMCDGFDMVPLGKVGRAIRLFKRENIDQVVLAGKIDKKVWYKQFHLLRIMPDWRGWHMLWQYVRANKKDDTFSLALIREFKRDQISFGTALDFCPELLVKHGFLTKRKPSRSQWRDIKFGWDMAKEIGRLDIGQTVVVKDTAVIAIEAIEGTDQAIRRAGELCQRGSFTVVKVAKPQQDMRFDVPAIGVQTIQAMHESGGRILAIESGMTIMLDRDEVIDLANKFGIAIVSLNAEELKLRIAM